VQLHLYHPVHRHIGMYLQGMRSISDVQQNTSLGLYMQVCICISADMLTCIFTCSTICSGMSAGIFLSPYNCTSYFFQYLCFTMLICALISVSMYKEMQIDRCLFHCGSVWRSKAVFGLVSHCNTLNKRALLCRMIFINGFMQNLLTNRR
jgi:hypothetical protein